MTISLQLAQEADLPPIAALMNTAFRGAASERSWCVETGYITGDRTSVSLLREEIAEGAHLLVVKDEAPAVRGECVWECIRGCVSLQPLSAEQWYLGSLTIDPARQNSGLGRELLAAAEGYAVNHGACTMEMTVVNVRDTLISWYERRGYRLTGETRPFPYGDNRFGTPTRQDLNFVVLERRLRD